MNPSAGLIAVYHAQTLSRVQQLTASIASGKRLTTASVDPVGFAMASALSTSIEGSGQALANLGDASSLLGVADGALGSVEELTARARELAVQGSSALLSPEARSALRSELTQIEAEIARVTHGTSFGSTKLLDGSVTGLTVTAGPAPTDTLTLTIDDLANPPTDVSGLTSPGAFRAYLGDLDTRLTTLRGARASVGAQSRGVESAFHALSTRRVHELEARSRIEDADLARAAVERVEASLQRDAQIKLLADHNRTAGGWLQLLG